MKRTAKFASLVLASGLIAIFSQRAQAAISITVSPLAISRTIDEDDLQAGAGSDLNPTYRSTSNLIRIDITDTIVSWEVYVKKTDTNWHPNLRLGVMRTTDGDGLGSISDGTSWQEVTNGWQLFFSGSEQRLDIRVQIALTGVSLQIPVDTYITTVSYGVIE